MAGYSGTPLSKKLGIAPPMTLVSIDAPQGYSRWVKAPKGVSIVSGLVQPLNAVHVFVRKRAVLERHLACLRSRLEETGFVWVSWPKKASKIDTDITEDTIRTIALPLGFVDIKVCAINDVWSGLKLVIRRSERARTDTVR